MCKRNQEISLPDNRRLGFDEYGASDGKPLFYFHGAPSARVEWNLFGCAALAQKHQLRVIVPDRPGLGLSDFQPGRQLLDWPTDVSALADSLGLDRFAIMGCSAGGPYAAACALKLPERLTHVLMVSSVGPHNEPGLTDDITPQIRQSTRLACDKPWLYRLILRMMNLLARYAPQRLIAQAIATLPAPDQATLTQPEFQRGFVAMLKEALRHGPRGAQVDTALMVSPWGFSPQAITAPVQLWHGEADRNAPIAMGRYLAAAIPHSQAHFYPGEGHLSLLAKHIDEILNCLALPGLAVE